MWELDPGYWNLRCYHLRKNGRVVNMIAPSDWAAVVETVDAVIDHIREEKVSIIHLTQLTIHTVLWNVAAASNGEDFTILRKLEERKTTDC